MTIEKPLSLNQQRLETVLFEFAKPKLVIVTTPSIEYNVRFASLPNGKLRHRDHHFEWTRQEFQDWANQVAERFNYQVEFQGIGDVDEEVGTPTQMGIFIVKSDRRSVSTQLIIFLMSKYFNLLSLLFVFVSIQTLWQLSKNWSSFWDVKITLEDRNLATKIALFLLVPIGVLFHEIINSSYLLSSSFILN